MLFARASLTCGATQLRLHLGAAQDLFLVAVHRVDALYDTRVLEGTPPTLPEGVVIFVVLEGTIVWHPTGQRIEGPSVAVIGLPVFEGFAPAGAPTFRTEGRSFRALEIRLPTGVVPTERAPRPVEPALAEAAAHYHAAAHGEADRATLLAATRGLVVALREVGLVDDDLRHLVDDEDEAPLARIWEGASALLETAGLGATLAMLAEQTQASERQTSRDLAMAIERLGFSYVGWRDAANRWRLRAAVVLLSGPDATVESVATAVGFSGATALGLAFRRAGLPSPRRVRARALAGDAWVPASHADDDE